MICVGGILDRIQSPEDLKKLNLQEMEQLCKELRRFLLRAVSKTGGHLASNLGVVELTVALEYCFRLPQDKIVWDVGHQAYIHKMLTGRKEGFPLCVSWMGSVGSRNPMKALVTLLRQAIVPHLFQRLWVLQKQEICRAEKTMSLLSLAMVP